MAERVEAPHVTIDEKQCKDCGFTDRGVTRFRQTVADYAAMVFEHAVSSAELRKDPMLGREVTYENVHEAALQIATRGRKPPRSKWVIAGQVGEYFAIAIAGAGASHLDKVLGILGFGLGLAAAVVAAVIRLNKAEREW